MTTLYSNLDHLSHDDKLKFYQRYINENATALLTEYHLHQSLKTKIHLLLPLVSRPVKCEFCESEAYKSKLPRKSQVINDDPETSASCESCGHQVKLNFVTNEVIENNSKCECAGCLLVNTKKAREVLLAMQDKVLSDSEKTEQKRQKLIKNQNDIRRFIPFSQDTEEYKLADVVTLMAIMFARWDGQGVENSTSGYISPIESIKGVLPDMGEGEPNLLGKAYGNKLLILDFNNTSMDNIMEEDDNSFTFYTYQCCYLPNFKNAAGKALNIKETYEFLARKFSDGYWYSAWNDQLLSVWLDLGVSECIEYAKLKAEEYNFNFRSEVKIREIVRELLHEHSVSECFYFISTAYWSAASFNQSNKSHGRAHSENTVPGKILSLARSGNSKQWHRDNRLPRSAFSQILFDMMLNTSEDAGFYLAPGKNYYKLTDKVNVLWPIEEDTSGHVFINGKEGLYNFLKQLDEKDIIDSPDTEAKQLAHLSIIAARLGLVKAALAIDKKLMSVRDKKYRDSLFPAAAENSNDTY